MNPEQSKLNVSRTAQDRARMPGDSSRWPLPLYDHSDEPHFLFIITPPYSGSTALSELINSSHRTMILQERGEGQWLIPGLCENDRWNPGKEVNYESVRAVWLRQYQNISRLVRNIDVVIEKSPPNMMRFKALSAQFRDYSAIANNRDPWAHCASMFYRHYDAKNIGVEERKKILAKLASDWIVRSRKIRELVQELKIPLLTYEKFCENPSSVINLLRTPDGVTDGIDPDGEVKVKDYDAQKISNQNQRQIARLNDSDIDLVAAVLARHEALLNYYGYTITVAH